MDSGANANRIGVLGDGAWGTAVALALLGAGREVRIWGHDPGYLDAMNQARLNPLFLPDCELPGALGFEPDIARAVEWADVVVSAIPSKYLRRVYGGGRAFYPASKPIVSLTKGLEPETLLRPSEIIRECLGAERIAVLSGPSHAEEVAKNLPASLVAASERLETARCIQAIFSTPRFRVYASGDVVGVETAGAAKNVIALAAGIAHGLELGDNALAALMTRGLAEITRLGVVLGGEPQTFSGLAGMGDLITTCISPFGRNRQVGVRLAGGESLTGILESIPGIPEGVTTTAGLLGLAREKGVGMPIAEQVALVLWEDKDPERAVNDLMARARKDED